jgi:hypothetical protein
MEYELEHKQQDGKDQNTDRQHSVLQEHPTPDESRD